MIQNANITHFTHECSNYTQYIITQYTLTMVFNFINNQASGDDILKKYLLLMNLFTFVLIFQVKWVKEYCYLITTGYSTKSNYPRSRFCNFIIFFLRSSRIQNLSLDSILVSYFGFYVLHMTQQYLDIFWYHHTINIVVNIVIS